MSLYILILSVLAFQGLTKNYVVNGDFSATKATNMPIYVNGLLGWSCKSFIMITSGKLLQKFDWPANAQSLTLSVALKQYDVYQPVTNIVGIYEVRIFYSTYFSPTDADVTVTAFTDTWKLNAPKGKGKQKSKKLTFIVQGENQIRFHVSSPCQVDIGMVQLMKINHDKIQDDYQDISYQIDNSNFTYPKNTEKMILINRLQGWKSTSTLMVESNDENPDQPSQVIIINKDQEISQQISLYSSTYIITVQYESFNWVMNNKAFDVLWNDEVKLTVNQKPKVTGTQTETFEVSVLLAENVLKIKSYQDYKTYIKRVELTAKYPSEVQKASQPKEQSWEAWLKNKIVVNDPWGWTNL